jgi:hypothetical protein
MRKLLWALARIDCLSATLLLAKQDYEVCGQFVARAGELLECRARSRDPQDPWQPVLAARDLDLH